MSAVAERISLRRAPGRSLAWHPEWWLYAVAGASALLLVVGSLASTDAGAATAHVHEGHHGMAATPDSLSQWAMWPGVWWHWTLMVGAMMLPIVAPQVRRVALRSVWSRRHRGAATFLLGYVVVWLAFGAVLLAVLAAFDISQPQTLWLVVALLVAAVWQVSRPRRRVLRRCAALRLGAATGLAADLDCARAGLRSGLRCAFTCGPLMVAMALSHSLLLMGGVLTVLLTERARGANPVRRAGRPHEALALGGFAVVAGLAGHLW